MNIRKQLWLSSLVTMVITIVLLITVSFLIAKNYQNILRFNPPPLEEGREEEPPQSFDPLEREIRLAERIVARLLRENPAALEDLEYLQQMDAIMNVSNNGIIVRKNNELLYSSPFLSHLGLEKEEIRKLLTQSPSFPPQEIIKFKESIYLKKLDFHFPDDSAGEIILVSDITSTLADLTRFRNSVFGLLILFLLALVLISTISTYLLSRNIVKPLTQLENAALQLGKGNYDFRIDTTAKNEIGDLLRAFEETRKQLKETEQIKRKYENNRNELISNISHDLKTPITTIKGYVEGLIDGIPTSPEKKSKYLQTIYQNTVNMESLINELFLLSELDLKELPLNFEPLDIQAYLTDCVEELKFYLAEKGVTLKFETAVKGSEQVYADRDKLKRAILNIINNAVNYKADLNPTITIRLTEKEEEVQIEIEDNGQGIPEKSLDKIFERFYKADKARSGNLSGTGLGLYIAQKIILSHQGKIWAKSKLGEGTSIFFTLKKVTSFAKTLKAEKKL